MLLQGSEMAQRKAVNAKLTAEVRATTIELYIVILRININIRAINININSTFFPVLRRDVCTSIIEQ